MTFDFDELPYKTRYNLLASTIFPRPIALVVTRDGEGRVNAAPFSFFNVMATEPPILGFACGQAENGGTKHTVSNIVETRRFTINLVDEVMAGQMNICGAAFPRGESELDHAGLTAIGFEDDTELRVAESPVSFECDLHTDLDLGNDHHIILGQVMRCHVADRYVFDAERGYIRGEDLNLIGRTYGRQNYCRSSDRFEMKRIAR
ncbi:flavin reductase family protein [Aliihoeflea sp. PC F10.4]